MTNYVELELRIDRRGDDIYSAEMTLSLPDSDGSVDLARASELRIDFGHLLSMREDPQAYGRALGGMLFGDQRMAEGFARAQASAQSYRVPLRLLLRLDQEDAALQAICWETLTTPDGKEPLTFGARVLFSRLISTTDMRGVRPLTRSELRALVVIASPSDLERFNLAPIDVRGEQERALVGLGEIKTVVLAGSGQATIANIVDKLRTGVDILYLMAHGTIVKSRGEPVLWLEDSGGTSARIPGEDFTRQIAELGEPPRIVLLLSGESAGDGDSQPQSTIGYQLVAAGVPAVVAMQGQFSMESAGRFVSAFFPELMRDGQIDRAMSVARQSIAGQPDWWAPVLLTRLRSGRLWIDGDEDNPPAESRVKGGKGPSRLRPSYRRKQPGRDSPEQSDNSDDSDTQELFSASDAQESLGAAASPDSSDDDGPDPPPEQSVLGAVDALASQSTLGGGTDPYAAQVPLGGGTDPYAAQVPLGAANAPEQSIFDAGSGAPFAEQTAATSLDTPPDSSGGRRPRANNDAAPPPADAPARPASIEVLVQRIEERYRPPAETLCIEIHPGYVHFRYENIDYTSLHALADQEVQDALTASMRLNPEEHGRLLFRAIFSPEGRDGAEGTLAGYERALAPSTRELCIELNLYGDDLDRWRWEYLRDPSRRDALPLATSQRSPLYRRPPGGAPAGPAPTRPLRICAAICSPPGLGDPSNGQLKGFAPIDIARQEQIIRAALEPLKQAGIASYQIIGGSDGQPATLERIAQELDEGCHVLHLLAHGTSIEDDYFLVMENAVEDSPGPFVSAAELRQSLAAHGGALRLVLLGACDSASVSGRPGGDSSLGETLVTGGVPAVIAMQDLVAVNTVQFFTQHFYDDLARSGRVDMAMALTRYDLYQWLRGSAPDWGIPVLYMGPGDGRLFDIDPRQVARDLPERTPDIKSFVERVASAEQIAERVSQIIAEQPAGTLTTPQLAALRDAVAPSSAPDLAQLAPEQDRAALGQLQRPLTIGARELRDYVEAQEDRLVLDASVYSQLAAALSIGKHIILTGPPGTGKSSLAQHICRFAGECRLSERAVTTTASADWTTFDTVGGYVPTPQGALQFRPGIFLRAICEGRWLVIDEINRAEIDKAFGELFTVLSGQQVDLPYWVGQQQVRVIPGLRGGDAASPWVPATVSSPYDYVVHPNWRIIGAMNVYDRSSLFALSFALMRRFAFIDLEVPPVAAYRERLVGQWLGGRAFPAEAIPGLTDLICQLLEAPTLMARRALGPAIVKDLVLHIAHGADRLLVAQLADRVAEAFMLYAVPQLDALDQEAIGAIYAELQAIFGPSAAAATMLGRIRVLYPHIRRDEWTQ